MVVGYKRLDDILLHMSTRKHHTIAYFAKNLGVVLGLVLIWRGLWYVLDWIDISLFNGNHTWTALAGVVIGVLILYLPDKDLKELSKL